ncbi:MAG: metal ABC transporter permease [Candidatus Methylacidiphilales bacterium]|nr:metal ABC transporter permease [Candidatus Methylacidiphilales bacterium]
MNWLEPLQYDFMVRAMVMSALIGGVCGLLSCFVILKGWSLMGDALSHSVVPGVAIAHILGLPMVLGAFSTGMLAALGMGLVKARTRLREDAVIGVVFTAFFALGLFLISLHPSEVNLRTIVFGNILGIARADMVQMVLISATALLVLGLKWKDLVLFCFDPGQARTLGLPVHLLQLTLLALLSLITVAALQAVGAILVVAMLVTPGATAYLLSDRFDRMLLIAGLMGAVVSGAGAYTGYFLNGEVGGCIVVLQTLVFLAAFLFSPKCGLCTRARGATP